MDFIFKISRYAVSIIVAVYLFTLCAYLMTETYIRYEKEEWFGFIMIGSSWIIIWYLVLKTGKKTNNG